MFRHQRKKLKTLECGKITTTTTTPLLIDWQHQYYENDYITESYLLNLVSCKKIPVILFIELEKIPEIHMEVKKLLNSQSNP